jgi:hypothetical protein
VERAFRTLPERYLGAPKDFDATYHVRLGDIGHTFEVRCTEEGARVHKGVTRRTPDVVIGTDATTWLRLRRGDLNGIEAYSQRLLYARGDLDLAVGFEGLFRLPDDRDPLLRIHDVRLPGRRVSTLTLGEGPDVLLIHGLALLCPAVAFIKRDFHPVVRLLRPELGMLPHRFRRGTVERQLWGLFADPDALDPSVADVAVDEFQRIYMSAGARFAFLSAARNIYLDKPYGRGGFYTRLADLELPSLFVWATHDTLIPPGFRRHVAEALPAAEQIVLDNCGHAPQIERPDQINGLLKRFFARVEALGAGRWRMPRAA